MDERTIAQWHGARAAADYRAYLAARRDDARRDATRSLVDECQGECPNGHTCTLAPDTVAHYLRACTVCTYVGLPLIAEHATLETVARAAILGAAREIVDWARSSIADRDACGVCADTTGRCVFANGCRCWRGVDCGRDIRIVSGPFGTYELRTVDGRNSYLVQSDRDHPGIASSFGWSVASVRGYTLGRRCEHEGTDGTIDCAACGWTASTFLDSAGSFLDRIADTSTTAIDPGYFDTEAN